MGKEDTRIRHTITAILFANTERARQTDRQRER